MQQVRCSIDGGNFMNCTSPRTYNGSPRDLTPWSSVPSTSQASRRRRACRSWSTRSPQCVSITSPTAGQQLTTDSANVTFSATDSNALTVTCNVDGAGFSPCASPLALSGLTHGSHTVVVRATDPAGNSVDASRTFFVDSITPSVAISSPTDGQIFTSGNIPISFTANDANLQSVECRADAGVSAACVTGYTFINLAAGTRIVPVGRPTWSETGFCKRQRHDRPRRSRRHLLLPRGGRPHRQHFGFSRLLGNRRQPRFGRVRGRRRWFQCVYQPADLTGLSHGPHTVSVAATDAGSHHDRLAQLHGRHRRPCRLDLVALRRRLRRHLVSAALVLSD